MVGPLITAEDLLKCLEDSVKLTVLDCRWYLDGRVGEDAYKNGHIPGSIFCDITEVCSQPSESSRGRHPLATPEHFLAEMANLGVAASSRVVVYDDQAGSIAGRVWWMLDRLGISAQVLDGGLQQWTGRLETGQNSCEAVTPALPKFTNWYEHGAIDTLGIAEMIEKGSALILDARGVQRYLGEVEPIDRVAGHIPTARSLPWTDLIANGKFKSPEQIRSVFASRISGSTDTIIASCGSGISACTLLIGMRVAGIQDGELYEGSYSGWSADPDRKVCIDPC